MWGHVTHLPDKVRNMLRRGYLKRTYNKGKMLKARVKTGVDIENDKLDIMHPVGYIGHVKSSEKTEVITADIGGDASRRVILAVIGDRAYHPKPDENESFHYAPGDKKHYARLKMKKENGGGGGAQAASGDSNDGQTVDYGREEGTHTEGKESRITTNTKAANATKADKGIGMATSEGNMTIGAGGNTQFQAAKHIRKGDTFRQGNTYTSGVEHAGDHVAGGGATISGGPRMLTLALFEDSQNEDREPQRPQEDGSQSWQASGQSGNVSLLQTGAAVGNLQGLMSNVLARLAALEGAPPPEIPEIPVVQQVATPAELRNMTPNRAIDTSGLGGALAFVAYSGAASVTPDFTQFINAVWTLSGGTSLIFPTVNLTPLIGRSGLLRFVMAGGGISYAAGYTYDRMTVPALVTTAGTSTLLSYSIVSASRIHLALIGTGLAI